MKGDGVGQQSNRSLRHANDAWKVFYQQPLYSNGKVPDLTVERGIHAAVFILLIVGLFTVSGYASYYALKDQIPLLIAAIALSWGLLLLVLYMVFRKMNWRWWE
jgi:hypothetical protein